MTIYKSRPLTIDYETAYSPQYSVKEMTSEGYIRDPAFKIHSLAASEGAQAPYTVPIPDIPKWIKDTKYTASPVICHNNQFDLYIMMHHYGVLPRRCIDTVAMARWVLGTELANYSLDGVSAYLHGPQKGKELVLTKGLWELSPQQQAKLDGYCRKDVQICNFIFRKLVGGMSPYAMDLMHWTSMLYLQPKLALDENMLRQAYHEERRRKEETLERLGVTAHDLRSRKKFPEMLLNMGITPGMKMSPTTGKQTYAFAKDDDFMQRMIHGEDIDVAELCKAKIDVQSSILETRYKRMSGIASRGLWPVSLKFCGARNTSRWSGGDKVNAQNLKRGSLLRKAVLAPPGYKLVVVDSANIELRIAMQLAKQEDMNHAFAMTLDPYCLFATRFFGRPISKKDVFERRVGKLVMLGLQYGMGLPKFELEARKQGLAISHADLRDAHKLYRNTMRGVLHAWGACDQIIGMLLRMEDLDLPVPAPFDSSIIGINGREKHILIKPTGFKIKYPKIRLADNSRDIIYGVKARLWGAIVFENICQTLAASIIGEQTLAINKYWPLALQVHDELIAVVPEDQAEDCRDHMIDIMRRQISWWPDLVLNAEGGIVDNYLDAK